MHGFVLVVAAAAMGIDAGWKPADGGGLEYIIQLKPHELATLANGDNLFSDIPSDLKQVRYYRIQVGDGELPREYEAVQEADAESGEGAESPAEEAPAEETTEEDAEAESAEPEAEVSPAPRWKMREDDQGELADDTTIDQDEVSGEDAAVDQDTIGDRKPSTSQRRLPPPEHLVADPRSRPMVNHADYRGQRRLASRQGVKPRSDDEIFPQPLDDDSADEVEEEEYDDATTGNVSAAKKTQRKQTSKSREATPQWGPLTMALLALFISLGCNAYLAWLAWAFRERYRDLLERVRGNRKREPVGAGRD